MTGSTTPPSNAELLAHAGFVRGLARALVVGEGEADDLFQETYLVALESRPVRSTNLRGWLSTVLRNRVRMLRRSAGRRRARELKASLADRAPSAAETAARLEIQRRLVEAVTSLDEPFRTTVVLRYFDGLRPSEIARRQGVPATTVHSRLGRAHERLRARLDREHGGKRDKWRLALLPLTGRVLMGTKGKATLVVLLLLAVTTVGVWLASDPEPRDAEPSSGRMAKALPPPPPPPPPPAVAVTDPGPEPEPVPPTEEPAEPPEERPRQLVVTVLDAKGERAAGARVTYARFDRRLRDLRNRLNVLQDEIRAAEESGSESRLANLQSDLKAANLELAKHDLARLRIEEVTGTSGRVLIDVPGPGQLVAEKQGMLGVAVTGEPPALGAWAVEIQLRRSVDFGPSVSGERPIGGAGGAYGARGGRRNLRAEGGVKAPMSSGDLGLEWLKNHQSLDGGWKSYGFASRCKLNRCGGPGHPEADPAVTGLALLAFLGGGQTHKHGMYRKTVGRGLAHLLERQDGSGAFGGSGGLALVNHAIATYAVAEAYSLTASKKLRDCARRAVDHLQAIAPDEAARSEEVVWAAFALIAAKASGLEVDDDALDWAAHRLGAELPTGEFSPLTKGGLAGAAVFCRGVLAEPIEEGEYAALFRRAPGGEARTADIGAWCFGSLALFQRGGDPWKRWNKEMKDAVIDTQRRDGDEKGSWDPLGPDGEVLGRVGFTALAVTTMEVYYRYSRGLRVR